MAEKLLAHNINNRKVIKSALDKYSQSLLENDFSISNDMITFDSNGILSNGQHRLLAVKATGKTLDTVVMLGVEQSSEMDRGAKRNIVDNVLMTGNIDERLENANIIKVCKALFDHTKNRKNYTCKQLEDFMNKNADAIDLAYRTNLLVLQGKQKYVFNVQIAAAFLAAVIYYMENLDEDELSTYMDNLIHVRGVLTTSIASNKKDELIIKLRDKIINGNRGNSQLKADAIFRSTQYCIYNYCTDNYRSKILCDKDYFI